MNKITYYLNTERGLFFIVSGAQVVGQTVVTEQLELDCIKIKDIYYVVVEGSADGKLVRLERW